MEREGGCPCSEDLLRRDVPDSLTHPDEMVRRPVMDSVTPLKLEFEERESPPESSSTREQGF